MSSPNRLIAHLVFLAAVSAALLISRIVVTDSQRYTFLFTNLTLAAISPLIAWWLVTRIKKYGWLRPWQILLTLLWISFLPNSFYLTTDLIHLRPTYEAHLLYDAVMLMSFITAGMVFGFMGVYLVHLQLVKRLRSLYVYLILGLIFLACSFAQYLGRNTRWNTWDILLQPAGLLFDVSDRVINPQAHTLTYITTFSFFLLLFSLYLVIWEATRLLQKN